MENEETLNYLSVAAQFVIAILSIGSSEYDKMITRKYINASNSLCSKIVSLVNDSDTVKQQEKKIIELTKFICAAIALELSGEDYSKIKDNGIIEIIKNYGIYKNGLILLDFRNRFNTHSDFLKLLVEMVIKNNIGTAGILQSAKYPIHESYVEGFNLEIMPCVTFHKGMESLFNQNKYDA